MIEDGQIVVGGVRVPIRTVALAWGGAIAIFGALSAIIVLTLDGDFLGGATTSVKIVGICLSLFVTGLAGLSGLGLLGRGKRQTELGVALIGVTALTAALSIISILAEQTIPGDRIFGVLWVLSLFGGLFGLAIRLAGGEQMQRVAAQVGAGAAAVGGTLGALVTLVDSSSTTTGRIVGACAVLAITGSLVALMARHADGDAALASATALE